VGPGAIVLSGQLNFWDDFVPVWTNVGTAGFSVNTGFYKQIGDFFHVNIYAVLDAAGSGTNPVTVTIPDVTIHRDNWQILTCHYQRSGTDFMTGNGLCLDTGSGGTIDRIRVQDGSISPGFVRNLQGSFMEIGTRIVLQGFLRMT
jgi:hypothetical protein